MNIVKSLHSSLLHKCFTFQEKHYFTVSVLWGFRLTDGEPVLEQDMWASVSEVLTNGEIFDTGMPKSKAEYLVHGDCHVPGGKPVPASKVSVSFAGLKKELAVFGDRYWIKSLGAAVGVTDPVPFTRMPLSYRRSFGGKGFARNPVGIGMDLVDQEGEQVQPLPNLEDPARLIGSPKDKPEPAGLSVLDQMSEQKRKLSGTYDQKYIETRMPGYPDDLNMETFNDATTDQWLDSYPSGNEEYEFTNLHPEMSVIKGHLPSIRGRCFVEIEDIGKYIFKEIETKLDTVHFFPGSDTGILVHRGTIQVTEDDAADIKKIITAHENLADEKRSAEHYQDQLGKRTDTKESYKHLMNTAPLIPEGCKCAFKIFEENNKDAVVNVAQANIKNFSDNKKSDIEKKFDDSLQQQLEEHKNAGGDTKEIEAQLQKIKEQSAAVPEETPESKKVKEAIGKISPDILDSSKPLDLSKIDLQAIDQLKSVVQEISDDQKKASDEHMKQQIAEARKAGFDDEADKMQVVLDTLSLPPVLPRIDKKALQDEVDKKQAEINAELHKMQAMGILNKDIVDHMEEIHQQNQKQMVESLENMSEGYRMGAHATDKSRSPHEGQEKEIVEAMLNAYRSGGKTAGGDYAFADLSNLDLSGIDLSGAYLEYANLSNTDLSNANLERAILSHATISDSKFKHASLKQANLGATNITACDFSDADTEDIIFQNANISDTSFAGCNLSNRQELFMDAELNAIDFKGADLHKSVFIDLDFSGCDFSGCNLSEASFVNPVLTTARFDGANLSGVNFVTAIADNSSYIKSVMKNVRFVAGSELRKADFTESELSESNLREADLEGAIFSRAHIDKTDFSQSNLRHANFDNAVGFQVQFGKSNLEHASLKSADFMEGSMYKARVSSATFVNANLFNVNFMGCTVGDTDFTGADLNKTIFKDWRP